MPNENNFFPSTKREALAYLYVQSLDGIGEKTPEELAKLYDDAFKRISNTFLELEGKEKFY